jgi:hypothetical protein
MTTGIASGYATFDGLSPLPATCVDVHDVEMSFGPNGTAEESAIAEEDLLPAEMKKNRRQYFKKAIVASIIAGFIIFIIIDSVSHKYVKDGIDTFLQWIEDNAGTQDDIPSSFRALGVLFLLVLTTAFCFYWCSQHPPPF